MTDYRHIIVTMLPYLGAIIGTAAGVFLMGLIGGTLLTSVAVMFVTMYLITVLSIILAVRLNRNG